MKFVLRESVHSGTGAKSTAWYPESLENCQQGEHAEIDVGSEKRLVLAKLMDLVRIFTEQHEERIELGHDCFVFAFAWQCGGTMSKVDFSRKRVGMRAFEARSQEGNPASMGSVSPGEIVLTDSARQNSSDFLRQSLSHFLVRATVDDGESLYASKMGTGGVTLMTLEQSLAFYPAQTLGIVQGLYELPEESEHDLAFGTGQTPPAYMQQEMLSYNHYANFSCGRRS